MTRKYPCRHTHYIYMKFCTPLKTWSRGLDQCIFYTTRSRFYHADNSNNLISNENLLKVWNLRFLHSHRQSQMQHGIIKLLFWFIIPFDLFRLIYHDCLCTKIYISRTKCHQGNGSSHYFGTTYPYFYLLDTNWLPVCNLKMSLMAQLM